MARRITQFINMLTTEQQRAYKQGRSTIDILSLIQNSIHQDKTHQLIMAGVSKAVYSIGGKYDVGDVIPTRTPMGK